MLRIKGNGGKSIVRLSALIVSTVLLCVVWGCTTRKNTPATRNYQAFITRYNIYYNGDKHFKETLADMEDKYEDDYSRQLFLHPVEAKEEKTAPQPAGNFDRSIEKAQKAIQLRSIKKKPAKKTGKSADAAYKEWMKREEYNPFLHNAWMMMGRGQYYNGDFAGAASTFFYISRHFGWLPATVTEAQLMQAMSYLAMGWLFEAELILNKIKPESLTSKNLKLLYNMAMADYLLRREQYADAIPYLNEASSLASGSQKTRLTFLLGQTLSREGRKKEAYEAFKKAGSGANASYRTKFNARIKQSEVFEGANIEDEVKALQRMTRYDRNKDFLDQVYYAIGNLYLSRGDTAKAVENYVLANEKSTRNGIDKAMNQLTLGGIYFAQGNYEKAQPSYSEAIPQLPESYPDYAMLKKRSDVLDELAVYSQNVNLQDSLLHLASLPEDELLKVINTMIEDLKKREKEEAEEARRAEYEAQAGQFNNQFNDNTNSFTINTDNSWYFYNTATKNAGKTEFQKRWGSRRLEDNWRRRNKATFNTLDFDTSEGEEDENGDISETNDSISIEEVDPEKQAAASDPHNPEYYLAQIPFTEEEKATSHEIIQEGLFNMGVILKDKMDDFGASRKEFDRLLKDYPDNIYRLDTYHNLYLMYAREGREADAERMRLMIVDEFPESPLGIAMRDPNYLKNLREMEERQQELYDRTYEAYLANDNAGVHALYEKMVEEYPMSKIIPKFMFLNALAYVTDRDPEKFNAQLRELLERYPDTDITPFASAWLKGMAQGKQLQTSAGGNMRGMVWSQRLTNDSIPGENFDEEVTFDLNPQARQLLIFTFDTGEVSSNALLFEIARHNFRTFAVRDFDIEPMNFGRLGMLVVKGFASMDELNYYRKAMAESPEFKIPAGVRPIAISEANFETLMEKGRSFDDYFRYLQEQNYIDTQADLLQPEDVETLEEADETTREIETLQEEENEGSPSSQDAPSNQSSPITPNTQIVPSAPNPPIPSTSPTPASPEILPIPSNSQVAPGSEGDDPLFDD